MRRRLKLPGIAPSLSDLAADLERWAEETGNGAYLRAARALWQQPAGRPAIDDRQAIAEVNSHLETGRAQSLSQACMLVAQAIGPLGQERSTAERLRRKINPRKRLSG